MILVFFTFAYYLRGKEFTMKVNRANLTYLGGNQTAIIVRWRIFIQSFVSRSNACQDIIIGLVGCMSRMNPEDMFKADPTSCVNDDDGLLVI